MRTGFVNIVEVEVYAHLLIL